MYEVRRMRAEEVPLAIAWAKEQGWNPGLHDAHCFYEADHNGFFLGLLDGEPIATGSAVTYGDDFAFCGLYIVKEEYRGHGYGLQLTEERLKHTGKRITGLDGVLDKIDKYKRIGYVEAHRNTRFVYNGEHDFKKSPQIVNLDTLPFKSISDYDRKYFPAKRDDFLKSFLFQPDGLSLGFMEKGRLMGYGARRKCYEGHKIGPLFAETPLIAKALFEALLSGGPIFLDVPEPNSRALDLVEHYAMEPKFEVIRMYRNGMPNLNLQNIYGITTFELG